MNRFESTEKNLLKSYIDMQEDVFKKTGDGLVPEDTIPFEPEPLDENSSKSIEENIGSIVSPIISSLTSSIIGKMKEIKTPSNTSPRILISKSFSFDAAHFLPYHNRRCKYLHGHTYHIEVGIKSQINPSTGMVLDYGLLSKAVNEIIIDDFDHGFINEFVKYPTAEIMLLYIWNKLIDDLPQLEFIRVWETDGSMAELRRKDLIDVLDTYESLGYFRG